MVFIKDTLSGGCWIAGVDKDQRARDSPTLGV